MNRLKKYRLLFLSIIFVVIAGFFYKEFHRKPADLTRMESVVKQSAASITALYEANETQANQKYLNEIIEVSGPVAEIIKQQDTFINIMLGSALSMHKVSCLLDKAHFEKAKNYKVGQQINIKGICTGFLVDVELNRCVIIENNP